MFLLIFLAIIGAYLFYVMYWRRRNLPPGPMPLPFLGNLLSMYSVEPLRKFTKKYGPVHTIWLGDDPAVLLSDYDSIMEALKEGDDFCGREMPISEHMRRGNYGIISSNGDLWKEQRHFAVQAFRKFGVGKNIMQEKMLPDVAALISNIDQEISNGVKEMNVLPHIESSVGSVINSILFGYRFEGETLHEFRELKALITEFVEVLVNPLFVISWRFINIAEYIPPFSYYYKRFWYQQERCFAFFKRQIEDHKIRISQLHEEPNDYVGMFLKEMEKQEKDDGKGNYNIPQLVNMLFDLWMAGQETTTNTISWGIIYLMLAPEAQEKLHKELDNVIGSIRTILMEDRPNLPYTCAVINEIQRLANIFFFVQRTAVRDTEIRGHKIPKGTMVVPMIYLVMDDEKTFPDPEKFQPERFLDENGQLKKVNELLPYSVGKRKCIGEAMANTELFLFIANLFNNFKISTVPGKTPNLVKRIGATLAPYPFVCHVEKRFN